MSFLRRETELAMVSTMMTTGQTSQIAVCAFVASNLHKGSNQGSLRPLQQGWEKRERREPHQVHDQPVSFVEFIRAHPRSCFVCYGQNSSLQHGHRMCPTHKADTEACNKAHGSKKRPSPHVRKTKVEVSKDKLSKLMMVRTELPKEIQEIKEPWAPKPDKNNDKDKEKKGKGRWQ